MQKSWRHSLFIVYIFFQSSMFKEKSFKLDWNLMLQGSVSFSCLSFLTGNNPRLSIFNFVSLSPNSSFFALLIKSNGKLGLRYWAFPFTPRVCHIIVGLDNYHWSWIVKKYFIVPLIGIKYCIDKYQKDYVSWSIICFWCMW